MTNKQEDYKTLFVVENGSMDSNQYITESTRTVIYGKNGDTVVLEYDYSALDHFEVSEIDKINRMLTTKNITDEYLETLILNHIYNLEYSIETQQDDIIDGYTNQEITSNEQYEYIDTMFGMDHYDIQDPAWNYLRIIYSKEFISQYPETCKLIKEFSTVVNKKKIYEQNEISEKYMMVYKVHTFYFSPRSEDECHEY